MPVMPGFATHSIDLHSTEADRAQNTAAIAPLIDGPTFFPETPLEAAGDLVPVVDFGGDPLSVARHRKKAYGSRVLSIALDTPRLGVSDGAMLVLSRRASENS